MHWVGGHTLVSVLFVAVRIALFSAKNFLYFIYILVLTYMDYNTDPKQALEFRQMFAGVLSTYCANSG